MSLISIQNGYLSFSNLEILKNSVFHINKNERICLTGKNGSGKSTFLKIINKSQNLDNGRVIYKKDIKISYLKQENLKKFNISIYNFISSYLNKTNQIPIKIEIEKIIHLLKLKKNNLLSELSGGELRKVALAKTLIQKPDILLLDEPTNHLDISTIKLLEKILIKFSGSILFISHNRDFIQNISTRIIHLDRGNLISYPGNYEKFLKLKEKNYRIEKIQKKIFDKKIKKEEEWSKKNTKARSTRNEKKIKNLKNLQNINDNYKEIEKLHEIKTNESQKYVGKIIFRIENINFSINNKIIIKNFSSTIQNGDKIGIVGDNGCGKSTIIKILLGKEIPESGKIYKNKKIKISYFDQNRSLLNPNKSIIENIDYGKEVIDFNGKQLYLIKYLNNFLFKPNQLNVLVKTLSGGQCNRLLLARLFLKKSNVLILDEPTNDLDFETLLLLEKTILSYQGTVFIVSHDEKFIKNTVNKYWSFENNGFINSYIGKYKYLKKEKKFLKKTKNIFYTKKIKQNIKKSLNEILSNIENIEVQIQNLQKKINEPRFFQKEENKKILILKTLNKKEKELKKQMTIWENLENIISLKNIKH